MKTKFLVAVLASAAMIVQVKAGGVRGGAGGARGGAVARPSAVAHGGAAARAPMRAAAFHRSVQCPREDLAVARIIPANATRRLQCVRTGRISFVSLRFIEIG